MTLLYLVKLKQMTNRQPKNKKMLLETIQKMPPLISITWFKIPGIFPEGFNATVVSFRHHFQ